MSEERERARARERESSPYVPYESLIWGLMTREGWRDGGMREDRESLRRPLSPWNHSAPVEQQDHNQQLPAANNSVMVDTQKKGEDRRRREKRKHVFFSDKSG